MLENLDVIAYSFFLNLSELAAITFFLLEGHRPDLVVYSAGLFLGLIVINHLITARSVLIFALVASITTFLYSRQDSLLDRTILENFLTQTGIGLVLFVSCVLTFPIAYFKKSESTQFRKSVIIAFYVMGPILLASTTSMGAILFFFGHGFVRFDLSPSAWLGQQLALFVYYLAATIVIPTCIGAIPRRGHWRWVFSAAAIACYTGALYVGVEYLSHGLNKAGYIF